MMAALKCPECGLTSRAGEEVHFPKCSKGRGWTKETREELLRDRRRREGRDADGSVRK